MPPVQQICPNQIFSKKDCHLEQSNRNKSLGIHPNNYGQMSFDKHSRSFFSCYLSCKVRTLKIIGSIILIMFLFETFLNVCVYSHNLIKLGAYIGKRRR
jgi:hypothetical protein